MLKFLFITALVAAGGYFVINNVPALKEKTLETINPAYKERKVLGEMKTSLASAEANLSAGKTAAAKASLLQSQKLLNNITELNDKNSGIVSQVIAKIADSIFDKTPFPADHLKTPTPQPSSIPCKQ